MDQSPKKSDIYDLIDRLGSVTIQFKKLDGTPREIVAVPIPEPYQTRVLQETETGDNTESGNLIVWSSLDSGFRSIRLSSIEKIT